MPEPVSNETLTILQYVALAVGTASGGAIAAYIGVRAKMRRNGDANREDHPNRAGGVQWWWDGPVGKALETLQGIYQVSKESRADRQRIADETREALQRFADERNHKMDEQAAILRDIRENTRDIRTGRPTRRD